jgi:hypothetical protein
MQGAEEFVHNGEWKGTLELQASQLATGQAVGVIRALLRTLDALEDNANARLSLDVLMLSLPNTGTST